MDRRERTRLGTLLLSASLVAQAILVFLAGGAAAEHAPEPPSWAGAEPDLDGILVRWSPSGNASNESLQGYRVYLVGNGTRTPIANATPHETSYWDGPLAPNVTRTYHVTAVGPDGHESAPTENVTATSVEPPGLPRRVHAAGEWHAVVVSWEAPDSGGEVTGYRVWRGTDPDALQPWATCPAACRSFNDSWVEDHVRHYYRVQAYNWDVYGPLSDAASNLSLSAPSAPRNATVSPEGANALRVSWEAPAHDGGSPIERYDVRRGTTPNETAWVATLPGNQTTYLDEGLANLTTYYYRVVAFNAWAATGSDVANGTTGGAPPPPRHPWTEVVDHGIRLRWFAGQGATNETTALHRVYAGNSSGDLALAAEVPGSHLEWTDAPLPYGVTRHYRVSAVSHAGAESAPTEEVDGTTVEPPGPPESLWASGDVGRIVLTWDAPATGGAVTGYEVFRGTTPDNKTVVAALGGSHWRSYNDTFVQPRVTYYYQVRAYNELDGPLSNEASNASVAPPAAPQSVAAEGSYRQVDLAWQHPPDNGGAPVVGYEIYRGPTADNVSRHRSVGNVTAFEDAGLGDGETWCYRVSAVTRVGEGPKSDPACATTWGPPSAPRNLTATRNGTTVALAWQPPLDVDGTLLEYRVYRGNESGERNLVAILGPGDLSYVDAHPPRGITLHYAVTAVSDIGEGDGSNEATALVPVPPSAPQSFTATKTLNGIRLAWDPPASDGGAPLLTYRVYRAVGSGSMALLHEQAATDEDHDDATCPLLATCTYQVAATNEAGEGARSASRSAIG